MLYKTNIFLKATIFTSFIILLSCNNNTSNESKSIPTTKEPVLIKKYFLKRPEYKLEYYADWKIDSTDKDFDIDSYFTLNSPNDNSIIFFLFNQKIDEKEHVDGQVKEHLQKTIKNGKVEYFTDWGNYKGYGASIKGKLFGVMKGELKFFSYSSDSLSFLVTTQLFDSDMEQDNDGLKLIETSFKIK